jgi:hypothetical protein
VSLLAADVLYVLPNEFLMNPKPLRSLIALNILVSLLAIIILVASRVITNIRLPGAAPTASDFEERLATRVGQQYTRELHDTVVGLIKDSDEVAVDSVGLLHSYGAVGFPLGLIMLSATVVSLIILFRAKTQKTQAEQAGTCDAEEAD